MNTCLDNRTEDDFGENIYLQTQLFKETQRKFKTNYQFREASSKQILHKWIKKFRKEGTVLNLNSAFHCCQVYSFKKQVDKNP